MTNYETWATNLWLTNNAYTYEDAKAAIDYLDMNSEERHLAGDRLREHVEDDILGAVRELDSRGEDVAAGIATDLLRHALAYVEWQDIAEGLLEG